MHAVGKISLPSTILNFFDLGGQRGIRSIWHRYYDECHAVAYVLDASDRERLAEGWEVFGVSRSYPHPSTPAHSPPTRLRPLLPADAQHPPPPREQAGRPAGIRNDYQDWDQRRPDFAPDEERRRERIASLDVMDISALEGRGVPEAVDWLFLRVQNSRRWGAR
ncbi:hypothetical protein BV22DRAFT_1040420 [Leucogyrophana mollusca]|uniref:Uncharacterized protein n=1 Tax=Leucogyrophana mollusca TaxID=85980 RepID=A0ACB8B2S1_9AGAM|nr:hypothetical protein BV22DRAFT_1040420 [Leucogyrophana mollusca]